MERDRLDRANVCDEDETIIKTMVALALVAAAIILSVSLAGKEARDAYNQVNIVPVEDGNTW